MQAAEAEQEALDMLDIYTEFSSQMAAIPVVAGRKSAAESFAGAVCTYTIEAMMSDRRALQVSSVLLAFLTLQEDACHTIQRHVLNISCLVS